MFTSNSVADTAVDTRHTHIHIHTYIHTQDNYCNPHCTCVPRVNQGAPSNATTGSCRNDGLCRDATPKADIEVHVQEEATSPLTLDEKSNKDPQPSSSAASTIKDVVPTKDKPHITKER